MQAGAYGTFPRVVDRAVANELVVTSDEIGHMETLAGPGQYNLVWEQTSPYRMSLAEAFHLFRRGQLDLNDPNSPIRVAHDTECADAERRVPELRNATLLAIDDGVHPAVIVGVGPNVPYQAGHIREDIDESYRRQQFEQQSGQAYGHDVHVDLQPKQPRIIYHDGPPPAGFDGRDFGPEQATRGRDAWDDQPAPMRRNERGAAMLEPRITSRDDLGFDGRDELRLRADEIRPRKIDGRGSPKKAEAPSGGEDAPKKIGRVTLTDNDHKELHDLADKLGMSVGRVYSSLRAPTQAERLVARSKVDTDGNFLKRAMGAVIHRDAEAKERLVTIDPQREDGKTMVVNFAPKGKSWLNLWSAGLHAVALVPTAGATIQAFGGAATFLAGLVAAFLPFVKTEHTVNMLRTGLKHMGLGVVGQLDYFMGPVSYVPRAAVNAAMGLTDLAQFGKSFKNDGQARVTKFEGKPTPYQRISGIGDTIANGIMTALHR